MRGIEKKTASDGAKRQTDGHGNSMTESVQWGQFSENTYINIFNRPGVAGAVLQTACDYIIQP